MIIPPASERSVIDKVVDDIKIRLLDLDEQLEHGEIKLALHHALYVELGWVLQIIDYHNQQEQQP